MHTGGLFGILKGRPHYSCSSQKIERTRKGLKGIIIPKVGHYH